MSDENTNKPSEAQINEVIAKLEHLQAVVPEYSGLGNHNRSQIQAQLRVLRERLSLGQVETYFPYGLAEEECDSQEEAKREREKNDNRDSAYQAWQWLSGEDVDSPNVDWEPLAGVKPQSLEQLAASSPAPVLSSSGAEASVTVTSHSQQGGITAAKVTSGPSPGSTSFQINAAAEGIKSVRMERVPDAPAPKKKRTPSRRASKATKPAKSKGNAKKKASTKKPAKKKATSSKRAPLFGSRR